jgi:putative DNA primase/helicase
MSAVRCFIGERAFRNGSSRKKHAEAGEVAMSVVTTAVFHNSDLADVATRAAARLNLTCGRDGKWRGRCPACGYAKPTLEVALERDCIAVSCTACGDVAGIAAILGIPNELVTSPSAQPSKMARAINAWRNAIPATGTLVESYLQRRGITCPPPTSIRFLPRQRNWSDGGTYPTMISLVQRVPGDEDPGTPHNSPLLIETGAHFTFLQGGGSGEPVRKAETHHSKLTLGQLRHGGVWLTRLEEIGEQLAVAEGIETALSVAQLTKLPTVAALNAAGMRSLRWPAQVRRLWIAADNDEAGLAAAKALLERALRVGLQAQIKIPTRGKNDFNDVLRGA